ncbi:MAG: ribonuclease P protein subunit [Nanoarchaeota archaeon]|nr:ribonuclease P protein subunit [Nanoarchaeota archaeon]
MILEEFVKHELIGLFVKVSESKNSAQKGVEGEVVDETKNMLVIHSQTGEKKVFKGQSSFIFTLSDGQEIAVKGDLLLARSEDRLKKKWSKKRW